MLRKISVQGTEEEARLFPDTGRYVLKVVARPISEAIGVYVWDEKDRTIITGRTMREYQQVFPSLRYIDEFAREGKKFVDVGTGVSEFAPFLSELTPEGGPRPTVIDPLDYAMTECLLAAALERAEAGDRPFYDQQDRIQGMLASCRIIRDATKVELINCTLGEAVEKHPGILGQADAVIDFFGSCEYAHTEDGNRESTDLHICAQQVQTVIALQQLLLKEGGVLLSTKKMPQRPLGLDRVRLP